MPPKAKKEYPTLLLSQKGDLEALPIKGDGTGFTVEAIQAHFKKTQKVSPIGAYSYKAFTLFLFGSLDGKEGTENQHQMPAPYDSTVFYQDLLIVVSKDENTFKTPVPFTVDEYEAFYTKSFGGYMSGDGDDSDNEIVEDEGEGEAEAIAEDGKDFAEAEEDDDDDDDEEDDEEDAVADVDPDVEAPVIPKVRAAKKKKQSAKITTNSILAGTATAYPDKPTLAESEQLQEEVPGDTEPTVSHRQHIYSTLKTLFAGVLSDAQTLELETSIYNGTIKRTRAQRIVRCWTYPLFVHVYLMQAKHIASNFSSSSYVGNTELFERFKAGEIQIADLATMDRYELNPSRWKTQFDNQQTREKRQLEGNRSMATDIFLCKKCNKRECTYYEMQTRSADEPMTIFITCLNCGKHWRQ